MCCDYDMDELHQMTLFTIGPVQMYPHIIAEKGLPIPYFRTEEFSNQMLKMDNDFKQLLGTTSKTRCIYLTASGTGAMEAAVINCFDESDRLLIINGGTFGKRFCDICVVHNIPFDEISLPFGEELTREHLYRFENCGFTGLLVNLDETSTGQLYNVELLADFCQRNHMLFVADAITTFLCDPFEMDAFGIDVAILSSQKGLCLSPGISIIAANEKALETHILKKTPKTLYLNFKDYISNMERGQTPFTPAVGVLQELCSMVAYIRAYGKDRLLSDIEQRAAYFRQQISNLELKIPSYPLSNAITPVIFKQPIAKQVFLTLKNTYGLVVNPAGGTMAEYMIRVSHVGDLKHKDYDNLIKALEICIKEASSQI